jgi:hypothetical protein
MDPQKPLYKKGSRLKKIIIYLFVFFLSFAIGRFSHMYYGSLNTPHHWIYGAMALAAGLIFYRKKWGMYLIYLGLGFMLSDFQDMLDLKFFGIDTVTLK